MGEFSHESPGERILKIGPHLPKLLSNSLLFWNTVYLALVQSSCKSLYCHSTLRTQSHMSD